MKESAPKKPLTPFFLFREKEGAKGHTMGGKEAGERWRELTEEQKSPYINSYKDAKQKYDKYLEEVEGIAPASSSKKKEKPTSFRTTRIRAVCGGQTEGKSLTNEGYRALGRVVVSFVSRFAV